MLSYTDAGANYYSGCNHALRHAVPQSALRILDVGCAEGLLGAALKKNRSDRIVFGIERNPEAAAKAKKCLDHVFIADIAAEIPPLETKSFDCIIFGDILEHLADPETVLRRFRPFLAGGGVVLASLPNLQHHSMLKALLGGDFQYRAEGLSDTTHLRFFTASTMLKLFLDAGYEPAFVDTITTGCPPGFADAARPLLNYLQLHQDRAISQLSTYQYIIRGRPLEEATFNTSDTIPLSFVACVSDESILQANLLASPCLRAGTKHEIILIRNASDAAAGLNQGLEQAKNELVICLHQDLYLPQGWDGRLASQYRLAEKKWGAIGVAGVYGVGEAMHREQTLGAERTGRVIDRDRLLHEGNELPERVATLDELLLVLPRDGKLRFDRALGFHLYGADICMQAQQRNLAVVALDALCLHNSRSVGLPKSFTESAAVFAYKWREQLPLATPCAVFDREGRAFVLGNSPENNSFARTIEIIPGITHPKRLASIIVPCWNQLAFTQLCLEALCRYTTPPWELILIDNGSTDGTAEYFAQIKQNFPVNVPLITNKENLGFPAAINQGLQAAKGEYLVLLNNDAVVTDAWLDQLIALCEMESATPPIGLVGPMSNYVSPPQLVEQVPYQNLDAMQAFALDWRERHRGQWSTAPKLSGFCLLLKRAVYEAVGGLDEQFGIGFFDDDDLAERARRAGFALAVAHDLFVHHFGSRTFIGNGIDTQKLLETNASRFAEKWGGSAPIGKQITLHSWQSEFVASEKKARISLTMIVRNEEQNLPHCLASAQGLFDEIIIADTGSTDRTREIARNYGARIIEFPWIDDFAAARNVSLAAATGDYAFWLDADDVLEPAQHDKLKKLLSGLHTGDKAAYVVKCACDPSTDGSGGETVVDHIRLFPLLKGVHWIYRVHEQILPSLRQLGVPVRWTDITVRHTGYTDPILRGKKLERDIKILRAELTEKPQDPFILFNLGCIAIEREAWQEALQHLRLSLKNSEPTDSITRKLFALISRAHQMLGNPQAGLDACAKGLTLDPNDAELLFRKAVLHQQLGDPAKAEACWRHILTLRRPNQFSSIDQGIYGHLTRRNLAALAEAHGDREEANRLWREVLEECPGDAEANRRFIKVVSESA